MDDVVGIRTGEMRGERDVEGEIVKEVRSRRFSREASRVSGVFHARGRHGRKVMLLPLTPEPHGRGGDLAGEV